MQRLLGSAGSRWILVAVLLGVAAAQPAAWATARLQNFQLPARIRIAGQYEVVFKTPSELAELGLEEAFGSEAIAIVEWPEKAPELVGTPDWRVVIAGSGNETRDVTISRRE